MLTKANKTNDETTGREALMKIFVIIILLSVFCVGAVITVEQQTGKALVNWSELFEVERGGDLLTTIKAKLSSMDGGKGFSLPDRDKAGENAPQTVYKWQDSEGNWHFSQEAPEGQEHETMVVKPENVMDMGVRMPAEKGSIKEKFQHITEQFGADDGDEEEHTPASFYESQKKSMKK